MHVKPEGSTNPTPVTDVLILELAREERHYAYRMPIGEVFQVFRLKYPAIRPDDLSSLKMRAILAEDVVMVFSRRQSRRTYQLWLRSEVESGVLERRNREIQVCNHILRQAGRESWAQ